MADPGQFLEMRRSLFGVAYRMLGSAADAEDILQEAYLRWAGQAQHVDSPRSFLTTVVVRLCLDHLNSARARRVDYVGPWLPEPLLVDDADPADAAELADSLSMAFLTLLQELAPAERAAFLLHDVFGYDYHELAAILDRREPATRQLVSRARKRVSQRRRRFDADRQHGEKLTQEFLAACATGDLQALLAMLADDVVVWTDGGGKARAARNPIYGAAKASRFLVAIARTVTAGAEISVTRLNGQPGVLVAEAGQVTTAVALDVADGRIVGVRVVNNPDKLRGLQRKPPGQAADRNAW